MRYCSESSNGRNCAFLLGLYWHSQVILATEINEHVKDHIPLLSWIVEEGKSLLVLLGDGYSFCEGNLLLFLC